ncbi:hypothetical protein PVAR5_1168 [Paecilomyces variotii No. 5]|uniref:Uncharacterized protein n=1 Tax=Byssochlamys spectabilis (strain No. 5 / NBRC 109023) TaxID=1356009 RepID=V5HSX7_BYSSN|nr:hypothetical protein PVAR5_1168 [Paecilomyces variotii No. 5]
MTGLSLESSTDHWQPRVIQPESQRARSECWARWTGRPVNEGSADDDTTGSLVMRRAGISACKERDLAGQEVEFGMDGAARNVVALGSSKP